MTNQKNRTWAEVDLEAIGRNYKAVAAMVFPARVLCVIKADAYGHGSTSVAKRLEEEGPAYFGVATLEESLELRQNGIKSPILLLGYYNHALAKELILGDITATIYDLETAKQLNQVAESLGRVARVHLKIDTGMTRLGFFTEELEDALAVCRLKNLFVEGVFSHFAVSDEDSDFNESQRLRFSTFCEKLEKEGIKIAIKHCANSGAVLKYRESHFNMVRAGLVLYGYPPGDLKLDSLVPAMTLKAHVASVKIAPKGSFISYGMTECLAKDTKVAVISIGYADGYLRSGSSKAVVIVRGVACRVLGKICMDMCIVDASAATNIAAGDEAIIFGPQLGADLCAQHADTITYEVLCSVSKRVPRIYK